MKYKVSLLPESYKKQLNGKKKAEQIKSAALFVLVILFVLFILVFVSKLISEKKLDEAKRLDNEYQQKVEALAKYRDINAELQAKVKLIDDIKVKEPMLYNFVVDLGNIEHPGVSVKEIVCDDWKFTRQCVVSGSVDTREEFLAYVEQVKALNGVLGVDENDYISSGNSKAGLSEFIITVKVEGSMEMPTATDASFAPTTIIDEDAGLIAE